MTKDDIIRMAQDSEMFYQPQAGYIAGLDRLERFAALVAAAERRKHQADIEKWKGAAVTAEKWRGMALSKDGDGRTVQAIQAEARDWEREACAKVCESEWSNVAECIYGHVCAAAIRARGKT